MLPIQIVMTVWCPFCLQSNFLGRVWQPSADNNGAPNGHYYLQRAVTPDQIILQNTVKSGNFVTFFAQNIFFHKISWRYPIFFSGSKFIKKWFRCWHGHFWPWLTSKPLLFYSSSGDEITLLEGNFVSPLYPWAKTWIWTPAKNFFSWKYL